MHSLLDVAKVADSLVFVLDSTEGWDSYGDHCLSCLFAQGLPSHGSFTVLIYVKVLTIFYWYILYISSTVFLFSAFSFILNLPPCSSGVSGFL